MNIKDSIIHKSNKLIYFITLFFPILGLYVSLVRRKDIYAKNIFWLFCTFLGLIQIFHPNGTILGDGADGGRYAIDLIYMHNNIASFGEIVDSLYNESRLDIYQPLLTFLVSRFTDNAHWLFLVFAFIFGYFYSRNIWYVFDRIPGKFSPLIWILVIYYILVCPIWNINGVRMWTALHIFVYGSMPYLLEKNTKKIIWCFLSIFVHFSFFIPLFVFFFYRIVTIKNTKFLLVFYIITLFVNTIDLDFLRNILENIPLLESRKSYISDASLERLVSVEYSWHVVLANKISYWVIQILIVCSYFLIRKYQLKNVNDLFSFSLFIYGISNIISLIPSGGRFIILSKMFMIPVFILVLSECRKVILTRKCLWLCIPLIFSIIFQIRIGLDYYGIMLIVGNFFTAPFITSEIPLIDFIK